MRALLDVNVLIALLDASHADHGRARAWLTEHIADGWASCSITENGFIRILSQPGYPNTVSPAAAIGLLAAAATTEHHEFWPDDVSILDPERVKASAVHGHRQITDVHLLSLATARGGVFATFDARVPLSAVPGATAKNLLVI